MYGYELNDNRTAFCIDGPEGYVIDVHILTTDKDHTRAEAMVQAICAALTKPIPQ